VVTVATSAWKACGSCATRVAESNRKQGLETVVGTAEGFSREAWSIEMWAGRTDDER